MFKRTMTAFQEGFLVACMTVGALTIGILLALGLSFARAHEAPSGWNYPARCCSDRDCAPVAPEHVREGPNGFEVYVAPGSHPMITDQPRIYVIPYGKEQMSPDGETHICISGTGRMLCFFTGSRGV